MKNYRTMFCTIITYVFKLESFRKQEVDLDCRQCFFFAQCCFDLNIQLRTVECCFTFSFEERKTCFFNYLTKHTLSRIPHFVVSKVFLSILRITVGQTEAVFVNTEIAVYLLD
ncbi:hypothetical protein D3C81_1584820 [compost metagenome]